MNVSGETESRWNEIAASALGIKHRLAKYTPLQKMNTAKKKEVECVYNDDKLRISECPQGHRTGLAIVFGGCPPSL
jgi:hypothetical protein